MHVEYMLLHSFQTDCFNIFETRYRCMGGMYRGFRKLLQSLEFTRKYFELETAWCFQFKFELFGKGVEFGIFFLLSPDCSDTKSNCCFLNVILFSGQKRIYIHRTISTFVCLWPSFN